MDLFVLSASLGLNIDGFERGIDTARNLLLRFASAVVDFGKDVVDTGMGFDKQMSAVQAVMGLTESTVSNLSTMDRLRKFALEQARDSIFTAEETATAYYYMGMAGWDAQQMLDGLPGVMALAAASGEDLKMTSDMVTDSLTAFGLGAGQASHFSDVLAVTATNANTDVARMQQTFKNLAPIAGSLGYSIEDVALSVGLIANSGVKGSQAGTALRNIFTRIATNAGATTKDLGALQVVTDELGVSFYTAEGRARPWGEVLTDMRKSWNKLDPSKVSKVTTAFGKFSANSQNADEIMTEFSNDLDAWATDWNSISTTVDREKFVSQLEPQFAALGISMRDSNGRLREFNEIAKDARVKLGGLTDQEQIYYGKQIGSLRGIAGFLSLMTASNEDFEQISSAIANADGAAQAMANTRLDNLWGDVVKFNAALDVLKVAIYDDVKGPLREVTQFGTESLNNITDAVNERGLTGGIEQLGAEIGKFGDEYGESIGEIGKGLVPLLSSFLANITPAFIETSVELGVGMGKGILDGIAEGLSTTENPAMKTIAKILGFQDNSAGLLGDIYKDLAIPDEQVIDVEVVSPVEFPIKPEIENGAEAIREAIAKAASGGFNTVEIDGKMLTLKDASALADQIEAAAASADVASQISFNGVNVSGLVNAIAKAGATGGSRAASNIQYAISKGSYSVNVHANLTGLSSSSKNIHLVKHAQSMYGGTILRGATIFGVNSDGQPMMGGEVGPEAIVGVNSLNSMIKEAVRAGSNGGNTYNFNIYQQPGQSMQELATAIQREFIRIEKERGLGYK